MVFKSAVTANLFSFGSMLIFWDVIAFLNNAHFKHGVVQCVHTMLLQADGGIMIDFCE